MITKKDIGNNSNNSLMEQLKKEEQESNQKEIIKAEQRKQTIEAIENNTEAIKHNTETKLYVEEQKKALLEQQKQLMSKIESFIKCADEVNKSVISIYQDEKELFDIFNNNLDNSINSLKSSIRDNTTEIFNNAFSNIKESTEIFNKSINEYSASIKKQYEDRQQKQLEDFKKLGNTIKNVTDSINSETKGMLFENKMLFILITIATIFNLLYNINYQFHCFKFLDTKNADDIIVFVFSAIVGIIIYILLKYLLDIAIFNRFNKRKNSYY